MVKQAFLCIILTLVLSQEGESQIDKSSDLYKTILSKDSLLFSIGFNTCDIAQFENLLSDNFEFLHDKDSISNRTNFIHNLKNGLCSSPSTYQSRRELIAERTEIYPLYKNDILYGAIQNGNHRFYETIAGEKEIYTSSARFTHVWLLEKGQWKLNRSLSFDHQDKDTANYLSPDWGNDAAIEKWLKEIHVPTLGIGIIKDGKLQQVKVFGELGKGLAAPYNTIFNVASLTKPVTAIVTLKLISQGKWDLDEPLCNYWIDPDIAADKNLHQLTTRYVLSHQTGFTNWRWNNENEKLQFVFTPGSQYQYSGEGFEYLRKALEKKFQKSLQELAAELIFEPLGMSDTRYTWHDQTDSSRLAPGYNNQGIAYPVYKNLSPNAADDLMTTIKDYGTFLTSVLNKDGLSGEVFKEMSTRQVASQKGKHFGLGFEIYDFENGAYALSHGGADEGCQTLFFIFPETGNGLIIFTNADDGYKVYAKLLIHYLGEYGKKIIDIETK